MFISKTRYIYISVYIKHFAIVMVVMLVSCGYRGLGTGLDVIIRPSRVVVHQFSLPPRKEMFKMPLTLHTTCSLSGQLRSHKYECDRTK